MPIQTPICDFGQKAIPFELKSTDNKIISLNDIKGENGTLIMFICNHCPYVKAVTKDIVNDCGELKKLGINSVAICSNDSINYPEDSFDNMIKFSIDNKPLAYQLESKTALLQQPPPTHVMDKRLFHHF